MGLVEYPNFIGQTYQTRSPFVDAERCMNLIPQLAPGAATRSKIWYYARPGLAKLLTVSDPVPQIRGLYTTSSFITYATQNNALYRLLNSGGVVTSSLLGPLSDPVAGLNSNYDRMCLTSTQTQLGVLNSDGYIWDGTTLTKITDPGYLGASSACSIKGYFVCLSLDNKLFASALLDGLTWPALQFTPVNSPDPPVAICTDQRELLWVFCQRHIVVYGFNASLSGFPFSLIDGAAMQIGLLARLSLVALDNSLFWLGSDNTGVGGVYRANGFTPQKVSTPAIDEAMSASDEILDGTSNLPNAEAYTYKEDGHEYYVIAVNGRCWAYDVSTQMWAERSHWNKTLGQEEAHIARTHTFNAQWGLHMVGDYRNGNIYVQANTVFADPDVFVRRRRVAPVLWANGARAFFARLELGIEGGQLLYGPDGRIVAPTVQLRISNDGGRSYVGPARVEKCGKAGDYQARAIFRDLGSSLQRTFEVIQTDNVRTAWTGAWLDMSEAPIKPGTPN